MTSEEMDIARTPHPRWFSEGKPTRMEFVAAVELLRYLLKKYPPKHPTETDITELAAVLNIQ